MIRIRLTNGTIVEMDGGDDITASLIQSLIDGPVTIPVDIPTGTAPTLPVVPEIVGDEIEDEDEEQGMSLYVKPTGKKKPRRTTRRRFPNPPEPIGRWPETIHLTSPWNTIFEVLQTYPDGMGTKEMGELLGITETQARGWAARLRKATPLIELIGNTYRLATIGCDPSLKVIINDDNPSQMNKLLGWQRFVALELKDGSRRKSRRS